MREMTCAVCGEISNQEEIIDFSKLEESDLGGQPRFTEGYSYESMVQCCPFCGYCNFDISKNVLAANKLLQTDGYQYIISSDDMEKPIANMAAVAYIYECQKSYYISAKAHSYASKMLEDRGETQRALMFKEQEVRLYLLYISSDYFKKNFDIKIYQYLIDALRRLKKFDKAIQFCDIALTKTYTSLQRNIFYLEKSLCMNYISGSHQFSNSNGEYNNFYQILIQGFTAVQSDKVYENTYMKMRSYLEKSVYFPISDGADFIIKIENTNSASMDEMIVELRKTYDRITGVITENQAPVKEIKMYPEIKHTEDIENQVSVLTLHSNEVEKEQQEEIANIKESIRVINSENQELLQSLNLAINEKEALSKEISIIRAENEKLQEELQAAKQSIIQKDVEKAACQEELEEVIKSRRELTADFDSNVYNLQSENEELQEELSILKEKYESDSQTEEEQEKSDIAVETDPIEIYQDTEKESFEEYESEYYPDDIQPNNENNETKEDEEITDEMPEGDFNDLFEESSEIEKEIEYNNQQMGEDEEDMAEFVLDDITEGMILSIAQISGQIDVSEVQGMLLVGYKNAKEALDKIAGDGKLQEISEDVYKFIEV